MTEEQAAALVAEVEKSWNSHDMERYAAFFAADADFVNVGGWSWRGNDEIRENHAILHDTSFRGSRMDLQLAALKQVAPDVGVLR